MECNERCHQRRPPHAPHVARPPPMPLEPRAAQVPSTLAPSTLWMPSTKHPVRHRHRQYPWLPSCWMYIQITAQISAALPCWYLMLAICFDYVCRLVSATYIHTHRTTHVSDIAAMSWCSLRLHATHIAKHLSLATTVVQLDCIARQTDRQTELRVPNQAFKNSWNWSWASINDTTLQRRDIKRYILSSLIP